MTKGNVYFEIQAENTTRAIYFYTQVFGWEFSSMLALPIPYWRIVTGGAFGGLLQRPAPAPALEQGTNAFVCSFEVENFEKTAKLIIDNGGKEAMPKFAVPTVCWQ